MSALKSSPAIRMDLLLTIPPSAITAISEVPPPMSTIIFPVGSNTSIPIPIAAAIGSWMSFISFAPACSAESFTALSSTSVIPEGIQITIRSDGEKKRFLMVGICLINSFIICSEASKSAITPSFKGLIILILLCVFPCINRASLPVAINLPVLRSKATMEGLSITTLSLCIISVFAVPKSIAISSVMKSKNPI